MKSRLLLLVLFLGCAAVAFGWIYESSVKPEQETARLLFPDDIDYFLTNLHYRELNDDGRLDFEFRSPRLEHYPLGDVSKMQVPSMRIESPSGPWQADAVRGEYRHEIEMLNLSEDVVLVKRGDDPMQVYTESLNFEPELDRVHTDVDILLVSSQARIEAKSAEFDLAGRIYRFTQARSVYKHEDS